LVAGPWRAERAAASALRWGLAIAFLACSAGVWLRRSLGRILARLGSTADLATDGLPYPPLPLTQGLLLLAGLLPVLLLSGVAVILRAQGLALVGPDAGSLFDRLGWFASQTGPLVLLTLGLVGHAVRERSPDYTFAAGLGVNLIASLLVWWAHDG